MVSVWVWSVLLRQLAPDNRQRRGDQLSVSTPLGIKALCIFCALVALIAIILGVLFSWVGISTQDLELAAIDSLTISFGIAGFLAVYGLWTVTNWGWKIAMGWIGLIGLIYVHDWIFVEDVPIERLIIIVVSILLLFYLYRKRSLYTSNGDGTVGG